MAVDARIFISRYNRAFLGFSLNFNILFNNNVAFMRAVLQENGISVLSGGKGALKRNKLTLSYKRGSVKADAGIILLIGNHNFLAYAFGRRIV